MGTDQRYAILKKIADGGMAEVFLATQSGLEGFARTVVVKRILPIHSADPEFRNMLVDEAHVAMSLIHGNIVPVLDLGQTDGWYFLVMELVDGWDLAKVLERASKASFPLPLGLALHVTAEVCRGLAYAHARKDARGKPLGIVHRDIGPQNILISDQGEVRIADFGIAKALGKRTHTKTGVIKGNVDFMSPEQASGAALDASSDIFSVGAMLYFLVTGQRPFKAPTELDALRRVQKGEFVPPETVKPDLPSRVAAIATKAMALQPSRRYRTATEMMLDAEEVLRDQLRAAGQSDFQQWLVELAKRDGTPPTSKRVGLPSAQTTMIIGASDIIAVESVPAVVDATGKVDATPGSPAAPSIPPPPPRAQQAPPSPRTRRAMIAVTLALAGAAGLAAALPVQTWERLSARGRALLHGTSAPPAERAVAPPPIEAPETDKQRGDGTALTNRSGLPQADLVVQASPVSADQPAQRPPRSRKANRASRQKSTAASKASSRPTTAKGRPGGSRTGR